MASLPPSLSNTLRYFSKYNYPLTAHELWYWQHGTKISKLKIKNLIKNLKLKIKNSELRKQRELYSKPKWLIAKRVGEQLKLFPTIEAVFVTGALAMDNCPKDDDIDLMIITAPNNLWLTRFFVNLFLWSHRRFPGQSHAPDKICANLWLDSNNLTIQPFNNHLYLAHEILQAKCIMDRCMIHKEFLTQNSWVKKYLPVAYHHLTLNPSPEFRRGKAAARVRSYLLWPINLLFFITQYLYMLPKMTSEKVSLGSAFFHPRQRV